MIDPQEQAGRSARAVQMAEEVRKLAEATSEAKLRAPFDSAREQLRRQVSEGIDRARTRGYAFLGGLEQEATRLGEGLDAAGRNASHALAPKLREWSWRIERLRDQCREAELDHTSDQAVRLRHAEDDLRDVRTQAEQLVREGSAMLGELPQEVARLAREVAGVHRSLDVGAQSAVGLEPGERLALAAEAEWKKGSSNRENPDGLLIVTDRRIVMERKEKEGGFLGFGGRAVQELCWELPLSVVASVRAEQRGLLGHVDLIHLSLAPGASVSGLGDASPGGAPITVEVKGSVDADEFAAALRGVLDGSLAGGGRA
jgi:hypothetical protein